MRNKVARIGNSAAYRVAFTYSAAFALAIVLLGTAVFFAADAEFRRQLDARIGDESNEVIARFHDLDVQDLREAITRREAGALSHSFGYALFDAKGRHILGRLRTVMPPPGLHDIVIDDPREGADNARAVVRDLPLGLRLVVAVDSDEIERIDATILALFGGAFLLVIALGIGGALLLGGYLRRRLNRISTTAHAIIAGDMTRRIPVSPRDDEFDQLAIALNTMLDQIAALLENLRQVSSDVAHDLRTPLAHLRNKLEQALDGPRELPAYRTALKQAIVRSDQLLALFAAILRISEVEAGALRRTFVAINLSDLLTDLSESYVPAVADGGRSLTCRIEPGLEITGDRELIAQALINLLDNAQRHTPSGTSITISAQRAGETIAMTVADTGPGVPISDRPRITRRFTRLDASRGTPGHGLGLNLVAAIAAAHGGTIVIDDNRPGLRVTLILPRPVA